MKKTLRDYLTIIGLALTLTPLLVVGLYGLWLAISTATAPPLLSLIAGLLVIAAITTVGVMLWLSQQLGNPLTQIIGWVEQINTGEHPQPLPESNIAELTALTVALQTMQTRVVQSVDELEEKSRLRTRAMETVADISRIITQRTDLNELLHYVTTRIQDEFDFYHTHIYLVDEVTGDLILAHVSLEVDCPLQKTDPIASADSPVGQVATKKRFLLNNNVIDTTDFPIHPLMPETRSELVLPLQKADHLFGVLDLHSQTAQRFTDEDVAMFQIIADQLALSIAQSQEASKATIAFHEIERLNKRLTRENWAESMREESDPIIGYRFRQGHLMPLKQEFQREADNGQLTVPLILRGEQIGQLRVQREDVTASWRNEEVTAVRTVANQVTLALENARLSTEQEKTIFKLQELDRLKSEFLTSMSHELRTPLNAILGFSDLLLQGIDGDLTDYARNDVQLIYNSGQHLLTLINDILDISKIEAGMMEIVPEELEIPPLIQEVFSASETLILTKSVTLHTDLPADLPLVYADRIRLKQILLNLVGNAAKFTNEGTIFIKVRPDPEQPTMVRFSIIDTGIGIPEDKQEAIFERFKQADMANTREYGGTGLGLTICKQLTQMHGGELRVKSKPKEGSEFYFTIPLAEFVELDN